MFEVTGLDSKASTLHLGRGGFQEARGSCGRGGHDWYVDNVKELLDVPTEWWVDHAAGKLFYFPNATAPEGQGQSQEARVTAALRAAASSEFVASRLDTLVAVNGTQAAPVRDVVIKGLALANAAPTFLKDYEVPSAGDRSIHRGGSVFIQGAENVSVQSCLFDQAGGNGVAISKYTRDVSVLDNEMHRLGDSGVVVVGDLKYMTPKPWEHLDGQCVAPRLVAPCAPLNGRVRLPLSSFMRRAARQQRQRVAVAVVAYALSSRHLCAPVDVHVCARVSSRLVASRRVSSRLVASRRPPLVHQVPDQHGRQGQPDPRAGRVHQAGRRLLPGPRRQLDRPRQHRCQRATLRGQHQRRCVWRARCEGQPPRQPCPGDGGSWVRCVAKMASCKARPWSMISIVSVIAETVGRRLCPARTLLCACPA